MIKSIPSLFRRLLIPPMFTKILRYQFASQFVIDPFVQHYAQLAMRQHRRLYLNRSVLNQNKDVLYAQMRKPNDGMIDLKQKGKCPGVIQRLSQNVQDQIDIVLDGKKMRKLSKRQHYPLVPVYIRVQGKQYRCIFYHKQYHQDGFLQKVYLKQYIPGKPNKLKIPIQVTHWTSNAYCVRGGQIDNKLQQINVICYNQQYPMRLYVDISYCTPDRPYRVGDLANILPPGLLIDPRHNMNDKIADVIQQQRISKQQKQQTLKKFMESGKKSKQASKAGQPAAGGTPAGDAGKDKGAGGASSGATAAGGTAATSGGAKQPAGKK